MAKAFLLLETPPRTGSSVPKVKWRVVAGHKFVIYATRSGADNADREISGLIGKNTRIHKKTRISVTSQRDTSTFTRSSNSTTKRKHPKFWLIAEASTPEFFSSRDRRTLSSIAT